MAGSSEELSAGASENAFPAAEAAAREQDILQYGVLRIYPKRYEVFVEDTEISLTNKEYQLLLLLVENEGYVMTRDVLLDRIWDLGSEPENRTLDVHIRKIRSKLGDASAWIETIRGVGYRFRLN
jgi:two-component system alkaline phosphatase synthesis response regulator PhoP